MGSCNFPTQPGTVPSMSRLTKIAAIREQARNGTARRIREMSNVSQREVADEIGVSHAALSRWENGVTSPRADAAVRYYDIIVDLRNR